MRGPTRNGHMTHFGCRPRIFNTTPSLYLKTNVVQGLRVLLVWIKCSFHSEPFPLKFDWMHFSIIFQPPEFKVGPQTQVVQASVSTLPND